MHRLAPCCGLALALASFGALAGSLGVGPTVIELTPARRVATVKVQNTGGEKTIVQLETVSWSQSDSQDVLAPTEELLATPAVFQLAPGESREVRVGLRDAAPAAAERSYRLYVREVIPTKAQITAQLSFALRIGVPIFVAAARGQPPASVTAATQVDAGSCQTFTLRNVGATRVRATQMHVVRDGRVAWQSTTPFYLLAGATRVIKPDVCLRPAGGENPAIRLTSESGQTIVAAPVS